MARSSAVGKLLHLPARLLHKLLHDARVSGLLLVAALWYPRQLRRVLPGRLAAILTSPRGIRVLQVLCGISGARQTNAWLSARALNNGLPPARFVKSQELVLITGGVGDIGTAMAREFASRGVKVVVLDLVPPEQALPSNIHFYQADVTSPTAIAEVAAQIRRQHGSPTVLINNAGIVRNGGILEISDAHVQQVMGVNTVAHWVLAREFVPAMVARNHGHVVTVASLASYLVFANNVVYSASKASALAFHEGLAAELKHKYKAPNVRTTTVHPSWVRTAMTAQLVSRPDFRDPLLEILPVATAIVDQVMSGRSAHLILPREFTHLSYIRAWPAWLQDLFRKRVLAPRLAFLQADANVSSL